MKALVVVAAAALALAPPAAAKELLRATICGSSGCRTVTDRQTLNGIPSGESTKPLGAVAPYYRLALVIANPSHARFTLSLYYVPSENAMAWSEGGLVRLHPIYGRPTTTLMRNLAAGLQPFAPPRVTSVVVGAHRIVGPAAQSYLQLFAESRESSQAESRDEWIQVDFRSSTGSPWTDGRPDLMYSPGENLLQRGWTRVEVVPAALADDLEAGRALDATGSRGRAWLVVPVVGALVVLALLAAAVVLARRERAARRRPLDVQIGVTDS